MRRGRVAGINTAIIAMAQGIGFAIPAATAQWVLTEILTQGRVRRAWLGVAARDRPLDLRLVRALGLAGRARGGDPVARERRDLPHEADLQPGDLIVAVERGGGGRHRHAAPAARARAARQELRLQIVRRTQRLTVALTAREPPP